MFTTKGHSTVVLSVAVALAIEATDLNNVEENLKQGIFRVTRSIV